MSNIYTAAQEAERVAREACTRLYVQVIGTDHCESRCYAEEVKGERPRATTDAQRCLCLAAAGACDAMVSVAREMEDECEGSLLLREAAAAIAEDYAARAVAWRTAAATGRTQT